MGGKRRRYADQDRIGAGEFGEVGARQEAAPRDRLAKALGGKVMDIGAPLPERRDLAGIDVDTDHGEAVVEQSLHQRQADIAEPDDGDRGAAVAEAARQLFDRRACGGLIGVQIQRPDHLSAAAMLPPSTVVMPAVVLSASAWSRNAWATSSAVTSRPSRLPLI